MHDYWLPEMKKLMKNKLISFNEDQDPIYMLTSDADIALWNNHYLPAVRVPVVTVKPSGTETVVFRLPDIIIKILCVKHIV